jgi:hypothetical protein
MRHCREDNIHSVFTREMKQVLLEAVRHERGFSNACYHLEPEIRTKISANGRTKMIFQGLFWTYDEKSYL